MRVRDVAARLEVSEATVYALIAAGRLRCMRVGVGRGVIRVTDEQMADYLAGAEPKREATAPPVRVRFKHLRLS